MIDRPFWVQRVQQAWQHAPIAWLAGVRRVGKTTLARAVAPGTARYLNCELPETAAMVQDPVRFYRSSEQTTVIFDEIHYLTDPSRLLKIGADEFPKLRLLATGSSTLAASRKFRDTLTGRKRLVHLAPVLVTELAQFGNIGLEKRLYHGGLPPALLAQEKDPGFFREWIDSFFARDLQRLFGLRDIDKFTLLFEYLMRQSGGLLDITGAARTVGMSRTTVQSHLRALQITHAVSLVRPFFGGRQKEIVKMAKGYGFDTGFISFCRGWNPLRQDDLGTLWEHVVLEFLAAQLPDSPINYWRDRAGHEVDFVLPRNREEVDVLECKWSADAFEPASLAVFRQAYPQGRNYVICPLHEEGYTRECRGLEVRFCSPQGWARLVLASGPA